MLKSGFGILIVMFFITCDSSDSGEDSAISFDRETFADMIGNGDGITSAQELTELNEYFGSHTEAWCITNCPSNYWIESQITSEAARQAIRKLQSEPYPSEQALRMDNLGESIRTPFITISVFISDSQITLLKIYRASGPGFSNEEWTLLTVVQ